MKKYLLIILLFIGFAGYSQTSNDADAEAFITALNADPSGVDLTTAEMNYITQMVEGMKSIGVWGKITTCYPFVGGTAFKHKFNLKNPIDTDGAYRLTFPNGMTHSANGIQGNGTNQYADTRLSPSASLTLNNTHLSIYTNSSLTAIDAVDIGSYNSNSTLMEVVARFQNVSLSYNYSTSTSANVTSPNFPKGYYLATRTSNSNHNFFINSILRGSNTNINTGESLPSNLVYIGGRFSANQFYTSRVYAFASIGSALTDSEAQRLSHLIYYCQGILQRQ